MTDETTTKKKTKDQDEAATEPVKVCRSGAIAASIWKRQSPSGFTYYDYSLSRSWKTQTGKTGYSKSFFASNKDALLLVIAEASQWIAEHSEVPAETPALAA